MLLAEATVYNEKELAFDAAQKAVKVGEHLADRPERARLKLWYRGFKDRWQSKE